VQQAITNSGAARRPSSSRIACLTVKAATESIVLNQGRIEAFGPPETAARRPPSPIRRFFSHLPFGQTVYNAEGEGRRRKGEGGRERGRGKGRRLR